MRKRLGNERGVISGVILILFLIMTIMLLAVYRFVVMDYIVTSDAMELKSDRIYQSNLVESIRSNYSDNMRNDVTYEQMVARQVESKKLAKEDAVDFSTEYRNYSFDYTKMRSENGTSLVADKRGEFGRFNWIKFLNYDSKEYPSSGVAGDEKLPYRHYEVSKNWDVKDTSGVYEKSNGTLLFPENVVMKIKFDTGVSRVRVRFGNAFEYVENDFINRTNGNGEFDLGGLPRAVSWIELESDVPLGNTSISFLRSREIDIVVYKTGTLKEIKKEPVLKKTLRISLAKRKMETKYISIGTEGTK